MPGALFSVNVCSRCLLATRSSRMGCRGRHMQSQCRFAASGGFRCRMHHGWGSFRVGYGESRQGLPLAGKMRGLWGIRGWLMAFPVMGREKCIGSYLG